MKLQLMFDEPSTRFDECLPIGNGRLGAMINGGIQEKQILLNEETVLTTLKAKQAPIRLG